MTVSSFPISSRSHLIPCNNCNRQDHRSDSGRPFKFNASTKHTRSIPPPTASDDATFPTPAFLPQQIRGPVRCYSRQDRGQPTSLTPLESFRRSGLQPPGTTRISPAAKSLCRIDHPAKRTHNRHIPQTRKLSRSAPQTHAEFPVSHSPSATTLTRVGFTFLPGNVVVHFFNDRESPAKRPSITREKRSPTDITSCDVYTHVEQLIDFRRLDSLLRQTFDSRKGCLSRADS